MDSNYILNRAQFQFVHVSPGAPELRPRKVTGFQINEKDHRMLSGKASNGYFCSVCLCTPPHTHTNRKQNLTSQWTLVGGQHQPAT